MLLPILHSLTPSLTFFTYTLTYPYHTTHHTPSHTSLLDIVHSDTKLYPVFEFLDVDLKRYMENANKSGNPISLDLVKVSNRWFLSINTHNIQHI